VKHDRSTIPTGIKVACALLIALPAFDLAVRYSALSAEDFSKYGGGLPVLFIACGLLAFGFAQGVNWVRWLFAVFDAVNLLAALVPTFMILLPRMPGYSGPLKWCIGFAILVLCFLPASNRHFERRRGSGRCASAGPDAS
jgi:peptidoglycan/LPS O-acetylase OafA/YrhL